MLAKKIYVTAIAAALGATLAAPLAFPENFRSGQRTEAQDEIAKNLDQFESAAAALQRQADEYATSMRAHRPQRESHARQLTGVKEQVNYLGRQLSKLEELSPAGTSLQQRAIEVARPHLEAVAEDVQIAIVMLNDDKQGHWTLEFREAVQDINEHADVLYTKVDAITDYEKARDRADSMKPLAES